MLTANFVRGANVEIFTQPAGLKLVVDGRDNLPDYRFGWALGSKHTLSAPAEQYDARGRKYTFAGWSNNASATQELVIPDNVSDSGVRLWARYDLLGKLTVTSSIANVSVRVDGKDCATPCVLDRTSGTKLAVTAPLVVPETDDKHWELTGSPEQTFLFDSDTHVLNFDYHGTFRLSLKSEPANSATFRSEPASATGFYPVGTKLNVFLDANPGYKFKRWEGDVTGIYRPGILTMNGPRNALAMMEAAPYVPPSAVQNGVGETPETAVSAGSVIAIRGLNLAPIYECGPESPLCQTLCGLTVQVADRVLPLYFVSPEQINAQLPSDLKNGSYKLSIKGLEAEDLSADFEVVRNAPGLFYSLEQGKAIAIAQHADSSLISAQKPVRKGETITLLANGLGPYVITPPDGFSVVSEQHKLADKVEVLVGKTVLQPEFAGAAVNRVGVQAIRIKLPASISSAELGQSAEVVVRIGGKESNRVLLPLE